MRGVGRCSLAVGGWQKPMLLEQGRRVISRLIWATVFFAISGGLLLANDQRPTPEAQKEGAITRKDLSAFTIIGIEARTDNAKESTAHGVIPLQWQKFFSEGIPGQIPNKTGPNFYAVYTDYANDHTGEYTYIIGAAAKDGTAPPSGMVLRLVPAGQYAVFTTDKGPFAKVVPAAWQRIFELEEEGKLKRKYQTDFEVYDQRAQDPQNAQVDIYIGIK